MKEVIRETPPTSVTLLGDATDRKYYGISQHKTIKGLITRSDYNRGDWQARCRDSFTMANKWGNWSGDHHTSLQALISKLITEGYKVYEFDTPQELFKWLSE